MNIYKFDVKFTTGAIYAPDFVLVVNDHNSTTFQFTFDQKGRYVFKLLYPDGTIYVQDIIDNELTLTKGVLNQAGNYKFEISLYDTDNRLTTARIKEFPVRQELVETDEPVQADDRVPILDNLIEETNKIVEAAKNGDLDGATFTPSVSEDGDLSWTNDKGKENPPTVNIKGQPGAPGEPGAVKMQVVDTLPDVGETDTIYLVKKNNPGEQNLYDEYVYTEASGWEHIGDTSVDLTDYYTKEDISTCYITSNIPLPSSSGSKKDIPSTVLNKIQEYINNAFGKIERFAIQVPVGNQYIITRFTSFYDGSVFNTKTLSSKPTTIILTGLYKVTDTGMYTTEYSLNSPTMSKMQINLTLSWKDNICTITDGYIRKPSTTDYFQGSQTIASLYLGKHNTTAYTPTQDYNPSTKKYVDDNVPLIPIYDVGFCAYTLKSASGGTSWASVSDLDIAKKAIDVINTAYSKGYSYFILTAHHMDYSGNKTEEINVFKSTINDLQNKPTSITLLMDHDLTMPFNSSTENYWYRSKQIIYAKYTIQGTWENNIFTPTRRDYEAETPRLLTTDVLTKNTTSFTPSGDYNLVHKKYVDDLPKTYTGYDATKTQVLKNVNGTLTWQNE